MRFSGPNGLAILLLAGMLPLQAAAQQRPAPNVQLPGLQLPSGLSATTPAPTGTEVPPRRPAPPAAVIAVMDVVEVMRRSTAAQHAQQVLGERQRLFSEELQREQVALQATRKEIEGEQGKVPPAQLQAKVQAFQQRALSDQRRFAERGRALQETSRYVQGQIQQVLTAVIQQVSQSRGVNLLLHREGIVRGLNALDLTEPVADQLNRVLPDVQIPPDGVRPPLVPLQRGAAGSPATGRPSTGRR